jgi:Uma2 family endonuclease
MSPAELRAATANAAFITVPPDWICEVLSKSTEPGYAVETYGAAAVADPRSR